MPDDVLNNKDSEKKIIEKKIQHICYEVKEVHREYSNTVVRVGQ